MVAHKPVAKQISTISFTLILGLAILSVFAVSATFLLKNVFKEYRTTSQAVLEANAVFEDTFEAQAAAFRWRFTTSDAEVAEFAGNLDELREASAHLFTQFGNDPNVGTVLSSLADDLDAYAEYFDVKQASYDSYSALDQELYQLGLDARRAVGEIMRTAFEDGDESAAALAGQAQESLLLGRLYLERFRRTEAQADLDRAITELVGMTEALERLLPELQDPTRQELAQSALAIATTFVERKTVLADAMRQKQAAETGMEALGSKIIEDIESFVDVLTDRQNTLGPRGVDIMNWSVIAICLAALAIIGIGWKVSAQMSKRLSGDIAASVDTMTQIAAGDLDVEVSNVDAENEIGHMARALEIFKENGKAAIAAAEREKLAELERQETARKLEEQQEEQERLAREKAEAARQAMIDELSSSVGLVVDAASKGDFTRKVEAEFSDPALTALASGVNTLVDSVYVGISETGRVLERIATGNLTEEMTGEYRGAFQDLQNNMNAMIRSLKQLIGEIAGSSATLSSSSSEMRDTSEELSKRAEHNAASLEETSAALEQLTASIKQVSESVNDANENAHVASDTAKSSSRVAAEAADAMEQIAGASQEIAKVVTVINDIAFQINLLALNAGVEAARAGDAGRGFSVVASEVRQLAQRAGDAAKEIDDVIARSNAAVSDGVSKVKNAQGSLESIADRVVGVSEGIEQITVAISEQVSGIAEINTAVAQIDTNTQQQAASFEEVTAASSVLAHEAESLKNATLRFRTGRESDSSVIPMASPRPQPVAPEGKISVRNTQSAMVLGTEGNLATQADGWDEF